MTHRVGQLFVAAALVLLCPHAGAQTEPPPAEEAPSAALPAPDPELDRARELYKRGIEHVKRTEWSEALSAFESSAKLRPHATTTFNIGACEHHRGYWSHAPPGFVPCEKNRAAQLGAYEGYPDEVWMDPSHPDYQKLMVEHAAARLAARGIDGFYLDNLELLEHDPHAKNGPCSDKCKQGGLDLVRKLRGAKLDLIPGMGHDLPLPLVARLVDDIEDNAQRARVALS